MEDKRIVTLKEKWRRIGHNKYDRVIDDSNSDKVFLVMDARRVEALDRSNGKVVWKYTCPEKFLICFPTCTTTDSGLTFLLWGIGLENSKKWVVINQATGKATQVEEPELVGDKGATIRGRRMDRGVMLAHAQGGDFWLGKPGNFHNINKLITPIDYFCWAGSSRLVGKSLKSGEEAYIAIELDFDHLKNSKVTHFYPKKMGFRTMRYLCHSDEYYVFEPSPCSGSLPFFDRDGNLVGNIPLGDETICDVLNPGGIGSDFIIVTEKDPKSSFSIRRFVTSTQQYTWTKTFDRIPNSGRPKIHAMGTGLIVVRLVKSKGPNRGEESYEHLNLQTGIIHHLKINSRYPDFWPTGGNELLWKDPNLDEIGNLVSATLIFQTPEPTVEAIQ